MSSHELTSINLRCFSTINHTDNHYCFDFKHNCLMLDTSVQFQTLESENWAVFEHK